MSQGWWSISKALLFNFSNVPPMLKHAIKALTAYNMQRMGTIVKYLGFDLKPNSYGTNIG